MPSIQVTAIIPTTCCEARKHSLLRAIQSLWNASSAPIEIIVVANGERINQALFSELQSLDGVRVLRQAEGSAPLAQLAGRRAVATPYFCFLDDDDEYLPGAIDQRLHAMEASPQADLVVTNGWRDNDGHRTRAMDRLAEVESDPLAALLRENWLASCGGLYRTASIGVEWFEDPPAYIEWTWLAFRLASQGFQIRVLDVPTYVIHDTPGSASKSKAFLTSGVSLITNMLAINPRRDLAGVLRKKLADAHHDLSVNQLRAGQYLPAWRSHLASLCCRAGWRYASYTARLALTTLGILASPSL